MRNDEQANSDDFYANWDDDDLQIVDLETLNETDEDIQKSQVPSWSIPVLHWQHSFTRKRWRTIATTCSVLLVCLVLATNLHTTLTLLASARNGIATRLIKPQPLLNEHFPKPLPITSSLVIPLLQNGFSCVTSEAWSPDSAVIALLGYAAGCEYDSENASGLMTLQDAYTGQRLVQIRLDTPIKKTFYAHYPAIHDGLIIYYQDATWSPDKIHLALLFSLHTKSQIGGAEFSGILLYDSVHKSIRVMFQQDEGKPLYQVGASSYTEWDILHGTLIPTQSLENDDPFVFNSSISVAQEYSWDDSGKLVPQTKPSLHTIGIGSTNGDATFTIWQPGDVELIRQDESGGITFGPGIFVWNVGFITWSPNGRYLINGAYLAARMEPPGYPRPDQKTLVAFHMENLPVIPVRDAALLSALKQLSTDQTIGALYHMVVAWSPNGQFMNTTAYELSKKSLYSTKSGFLVAMLQSPKNNGINIQSSHSGYYAFSSPIWSPDSRRVLAQDPATDAVVIWNIPSGLK